MSRLVKLAPLQTSLRHVKQPAHNADFFHLRISKIPANASGISYLSELGIAMWEIIILCVKFLLFFFYN